MKSSLLVLFILLTSLASLAQKKDPPKYTAGIDPGYTVFKDVTLKQKIELSIHGARFARDQMLDPDSFHVSRVWYRMFVVCMEFRSKNSMGGYVQGAGVYSFFPDKFRPYAPEQTDDEEALSNTFYFKNDCMTENEDKRVDVTEQVKAALKSDRAKGLE